jgi:regulator of protease activity HflC (stomatin/prohibitin superfamily)
MSKTIIYQNQIGLLIRDGHIAGQLPSGTYRTYAFRNEAVMVYPTYSQSFQSVVNVRTKEAAAISVEVTIGIIIKDAQKLYLSGKMAYEIVNQAVSRELQAVVESKNLNELLESEIAITETEIQSAISGYGLEIKIELLPRVRLPRNLQNAVDAQEVARQRAKAELEEARGRSAVIRHYANVAKVTKDNPDLLRLLLGQKAKSINVAFDASARNGK